MTILSKVLRLLALHFRQHTLSSAEASLWCREAGEREKKESAGHDGKGKERKGFSLFPSSPARYLFFDYCYFYRDTQGEPLRRREGSVIKPVVHVFLFSDPLASVFPKSL